MARKPPPRPAGGHRRGPGPDPRGHRLLDHRRGRSGGRAVRQLRHRRDHLVRRRTPGHDLGRHRRHGPAHGHPRARPRPGISVRRLHPDRGVPDHRRGAEAGALHQIRLALGDDRLRQLPGHPDLSGPAARADRRQLADLRHGRGRPGHHLSAAAPDKSHPLAPDRHRGAGRPGHVAEHRRAHRGRHGPDALDPAGLPPAQRAPDMGDPGHHRSGGRHPGLRGPAGIPADRQPAGRHDRHPVGQGHASPAVRASPTSCRPCSAAWPAAP